MWLLTLPRTWRRDALIFVVLTVWCNTHGSVLLGVAATGLAALFELGSQWKDRAGGARLQWFLRVVGITALVPFTAIASPYGSELLTSYSAIAANPVVSTQITEWARATPDTVPLTFVGLGVTALVLFFGRQKAKTFPAAMLVIIGLMAVAAVRHMVFFGITFAMAAPALVDAALPRDVLRFKAPNFFRVASVALAVLFGLLCVLTSLRTDAEVDHRLPASAAWAVQNHAGTTGHVMATSDVVDWLLYRERALIGRVACDARAELATAEQMVWQSDLNSDPPSREALSRLQNYSVVVFSPTVSIGLANAMPHMHAFRPAFRDRFLHAYFRVQ